MPARDLGFILEKPTSSFGVGGNYSVWILVDAACWAEAQQNRPSMVTNLDHDSGMKEFEAA